jgi:hypothetical protein
VRVKCEVDRLYLPHIKPAESTCFMVRGRGDEVAWRWHERFMHINMATLGKLAWEELDVAYWR